MSSRPAREAAIPERIYLARAERGEEAMFLTVRA